MKKIKNQKYLKPYRQKLRNNLTPAEAEMWKYLKNNKLGFKFRRQQSIGKYIYDFYCPKIKLIIELDGDYHYTNHTIHKQDVIKEKYAENLGINIIRFENCDIFVYPEWVISEITNTIKNNLNK